MGTIIIAQGRNVGTPTPQAVAQGILGTVNLYGCSKSTLGTMTLQSAGGVGDPGVYDTSGCSVGRDPGDHNTTVQC